MHIHISVRLGALWKCLVPDLPKEDVPAGLCLALQQDGCWPQDTQCLHDACSIGSYALPGKLPLECVSLAFSSCVHFKDGSNEAHELGSVWFQNSPATCWRTVCKTAAMAAWKREAAKMPRSVCASRSSNTMTYTRIGVNLAIIKLTPGKQGIHQSLPIGSSASVD